MKKSGSLLFLLCFCMTAGAQLMDSLPQIIRQKRSIDARLESRYSFIGGNLAGINGVRLGVAFKRTLRLGGGLSWLSASIPVKFPPFQANTGQRDFKYLKFGYWCFYADFVFHKTKRWQLSVPLQLGSGMLWYQQKRGYHLNTGETKYFILFYEPGITAQFKIFKWLGLGSDVAYRFAVKDNTRIGQRLSSPTYAFKILFWFDQLYYELLPESELTKRYGPAYW